MRRRGETANSPKQAHSQRVEPLSVALWAPIGGRLDLRGVGLCRPGLLEWALLPLWPSLSASCSSDLHWPSHPAAGLLAQITLLRLRTASAQAFARTQLGPQTQARTGRQGQLLLQTTMPP